LLQIGLPKELIQTEKYYCPAIPSPGVTSGPAGGVGPVFLIKKANPDCKDALAKRIKAYRRVQHMTQFDFSGETGLSVEEISHLEREETDPKLSTLQSLAAYMGVTVSDLLKIDET